MSRSHFETMKNLETSHYLSSLRWQCRTLMRLDRRRVKNQALLRGFLTLLLKLQKSDCHYSLNYFIKHSRNSNFWNQLLNFFSNLKYKWSIITYYHVFPGDLHEWQITCLRCNDKISKPTYLNSILTLVPIVILIICHLQRLIRICITFLCYSLHTRDLWIFGT